MGFSSPLGNLCAKTAPSPTGLASHATTKGSLGLKYVRKRLEHNYSCFSALKALLHSSFQSKGTFLRVSWYMGAAIVARFSANLE